MNPSQPPNERGIALVSVLAILALLTILMMGLLTASRLELRASGQFSNRAQAKMMADAALEEATLFLENATRGGNYITQQVEADPNVAPVNNIFYPSTGVDTHLSMTNAVGDILASRAGRSTNSHLPAVSGSPYTLTYPSFVTSGDIVSAFDFNEERTIGSATGFLVNSDRKPAYGEWVNQVDDTGKVVGRYAFYIEDESMKINVNIAGNVSGELLNDQVTTPPPSRLPNATMTRPDVVLTSNGAEGNIAATQALAAKGPPGARLPSAMSAAFVHDSWKKQMPTVSTQLTTDSKSPDTTAKGWQRMKINHLVAEAEANGTQAEAAILISQWIKDAWTGKETLAAMRQEIMDAGGQVLNPTADLKSITDFYGKLSKVAADDRLRLQFAANLVDYIDADNIPTNCGVVDSMLGQATGVPNLIPVIGIEKLPYLSDFMISYNAAEVAAGKEVQLSFKFKFMNMWERDVALGDIERIEVRNVPAFRAGNSMDPTDLIRFAPLYSIPIAAMQKFDYSGEGATTTVALKSADPASWTAVDPLGDVVQRATRADYAGYCGALSLKTLDVDTKPTTMLSNRHSYAYPADQTGPVEIIVYGKGDAVLDVINAEVRTDQKLAYGDSGTGVFIYKNQRANLVFSCYQPYPYPDAGQALGQYRYFDPRFRPEIMSDRFWMRARTGTTVSSSNLAPTGTYFREDNRFPQDGGLSVWAPNLRVRSPDFYGYYNLRSNGHWNGGFHFHANRALYSVGEIGNIALCHAPWRTVYLQHPERPEVTDEAYYEQLVSKIRQEQEDAVLLDLFSVSPSLTMEGAVNLNGISHAGDHGNSAVGSLFLGTQVAGYDTIDITGVNTISEKIHSRMNPDLTPFWASSASATTNVQPLDNDPPRPFLNRGQLASVVSRAVATTSNDTGNPIQIYSGKSLLSPTTVGLTKDIDIERPLRNAVSASATRGLVFRVLCVGQSIKDRGAPGFESVDEIQGEYLLEAFVEKPSPIEVDTAADLGSAAAEELGEYAFVDEDGSWYQANAGLTWVKVDDPYSTPIRQQKTRFKILRKRMVID